MSRPKTKVELLEAARKGYCQLQEFINSMNSYELNTPFDFSGLENKKEAHWKRDKNLKDVIVHLYEWQELMIDFAEKIRKDPKTHATFLPPMYNWKTYGEMNLGIWSKHVKTTLTQALTSMVETHQKVLELIELFTEEELFTKKYYPAVGTSNLASYFISTTSSHYEWAVKKLKAHRKIVAALNPDTKPKPRTRTRSSK